MPWNFAYVKPLIFNTHFGAKNTGFFALGMPWKSAVVSLRYHHEAVGWNLVRKRVGFAAL